MPFAAGSGAIPPRNQAHGQGKALGVDPFLTHTRLTEVRDSTKPGLWTLDWTVDWILNSIMDWIFRLEFQSPGDQKVTCILISSKD